MAGNGPNQSPTITEIDAQPIKTYKSEVVPSVKAPFGFLNEDSYSMRSKTRGIALIFNNTKFNPRTHMEDRHGSDIDATRLYSIFSHLKFDVTVKMNTEAAKMENFIKEVASKDHSNFDCFIMCILSHGDENGIYAFDEQVKLETLSDPFAGDKCLSLAGKPKLFFIQACQGNRLDRGVDMEVTDAASFMRIPTEADFLFAYSSVPGYFSWRNPKEGSWFIQTLCEELENNTAGRDLLKLLTRVNRSVAHKKESYVPDNVMNRCKQMPYFRSMLTKDVYFNAKS